MFFNKKINYLKKIKRSRIPENRDLVNGLRLNRNEKVDNWPKNFLINILKNKPEYFLSIYPNLTPFYKKLSKFLNIKTDQLLLTSGIDSGIKDLFEIITSSKDKVAVLYPTYAMYEVYSKIYNVNLIKVKLNKNFDFDINDIKKILNKKPKIFFLPNPNQPIEINLSINKIEMIAQECIKNNCFLVVDEAYHYFGATSAIKLINKYKNLIILRTFSKAFGVPSIRLGYLISNEDNMNILNKTRIAHESNSLSIAVADYLIDNFANIEKQCLEIVKTRKYLQKELLKLDIKSRGIKGNFLLIIFKNNTEASKIVKKLLLNKIYVKGPWQKPWNNAVTITIGSKKKMDIFLNNIKKIIKVNS